MKRVDARGLSCPEPVIQTKNAMASKEAEYEVLVDNVVAKENVSKSAAFLPWVHLDEATT